MEEPLRTCAILTAPLVGVLVGFVLSQVAGRRASDKAAVAAFRETLVKYVAGTASPMELRAAYAPLPMSMKKKVPLDGILKAHPDQLQHVSAMAMEGMK